MSKPNLPIALNERPTYLAVPGELRRPWWREYGLGIVLFLILDLVFGWWYYREAERLADVPRRSPPELPISRQPLPGNSGHELGSRASVPVQPPAVHTYEAETIRCLHRVSERVAQPLTTLRCMRGYVFDVTVSNGVQRLDQVLCGSGPVTCPGGFVPAAKP